MSSTQRGYAQPGGKSFSTAATARLLQLSTIVAAIDNYTYTAVSPTNYTIDTADDLTAAMATLTGGDAVTANETLKDLGRTLTVTAVDTGSTVRFAFVQRTNTVSGASGRTGYVVVHNEAGQVPVPVFRH